MKDGNCRLDHTVYIDVYEIRPYDDPEASPIIVQGVDLQNQIESLLEIEGSALSITFRKMNFITFKDLPEHMGF